MTTTDTQTTTGAAKTVMVHRKDHEGALIIDSHTGNITQPLDERPEWSDGLSTALLTERHTYYTSRLGPERYTQDMRAPELFAFEDLGWIGVDENGDAQELSASEEHRMEVIAAVLGVDTETGEHTNGKVIAEVELALDRERTPGEVAAFETSQEQGFDKATGTDAK